MLFIALGFLLVGLIVGGMGLRAAGRLARRTWRPGAGMLALAALAGAAVCAVREAWAPAVLLLLVGAFLSLSVRRTGGVRHSPPEPPAAPMDLASAAAILGVAPDASAEEVQAAYLRLIRRTHPDQGGTAGLASQLNGARQTMLKRGR